MKISQFTIGVSRTINLGNFESLRIEASVTADRADAETGDIQPGERDAARAEVRQLLEETYRQYNDRKGVGK